MTLALQKTIGLLLLIGLGLFLQKKVSSADNLKGIKVLILSVALPATIFIALLKIKLESSLIVLPLLAIAFNLIMLLGSKYVLSSFGAKKNSAPLRTLMMLLPSLAPGLSCFPFIVEYLDDSSLALAALADVGNKVFVLIFLYILAMNWYHSGKTGVGSSSKNKLIDLLKALINEPINVVIILALILLAFGMNLTAFPLFVQNTVTSLSGMMTPLVLLFIGLAVKTKWSEFKLIFFLLTWRAGVTLLLSALVIFLFPPMSIMAMMLVIVFPQSSCSFWPFAHMSAVNTLEEGEKIEHPTFDVTLAVSVLACSLPFSAIFILFIFSFSEFFLRPMNLVITGSLLTVVSLTPFFIKKIKKKWGNDNSNQVGLLQDLSQK